MPLPLVAIGAVIAPIVAGAVVDAILAEFLDDDSIIPRLELLQIGVDQINGDLSAATVGSLKEVLFTRTAAILADTQETTEVHHPELLAAIGGGGGGGGGGWDTVLGTSLWGTGPQTAGQLLRWAGQVGETIQRGGAVPLRDNPDFWLHLPQDGQWLAPTVAIPVHLKPRERPAGESVGAYLNRVDTDYEWTYFLGFWRAYIPTEGATFNHVTMLTCVVTDGLASGSAASGEYDARLATLQASATAIKGETAAIAADTVAILAHGTQLIGDVGELATATENTHEADLRILAPWQPRQLGPTIPLGRGGTVDLGEAVGFVLTITDYPAEWGLRYVHEPVGYHPKMGNYAFGTAEGWGPSEPLEWPVTAVVPIPPGATMLSYHVRPPCNATLNLLLPIP